MSIHSGWKTLLTFSLVALGTSAFAAEPPAKTKPRVPVTISKETTYITEPLREDGYPDYFAALNERMSKGVTPENNAAVPFWRAMGPEVIYKEHRERYFEMLGMSPLPERGSYFVTSANHIILNEDTDLAAPAGERSNLLREQLQTVVKRPWSKQEFPVWAAWLTANEEPLALVVEASRCRRRYDPLIAGKDMPLIGALLPAIMAYRNVPNALVARAMLRLDAGKVDEAWEDLLACHRLARLLAQGPTMIDYLAARWINETAYGGTYALLQYRGLTAAKIARMQDDFHRLPPMPKMADKIDVAERFTFLNNITATMKETPASPAVIATTLASVERLGSDVRERASLKLILESAGDKGIDWNVVLRMGNARYDQYVNAMRMPAGTRRREVVKTMEQNAANDNAPSERVSPDDTRQSRSRRVGSAFIVVFSTKLTTLLPSDDRATMQSELRKLAFALAAYHVDHNSYPATLTTLVPKYVQEVPKDIFNNDADLHYAERGDGYLLYSVGSNGKDDGGKSYEDCKNGEDWDDLAVRMSSARP